MQNVGLENPRVFSLRELKDITDNFSEERVIGRGGSGVVYKGVLDNGEEIAVKKLHNHYDSSGNKLGNGEAQFHNELMNLIGVQHHNIIRLVGYCYEMHSMVIECDGKRVLASDEERALCLEYMQGGSLKDHLSDESCGLEWHKRFDIIKGVCEGLKHLHTGSENPIYHLDLKPENIWLDRNMIPKIGDFGISRLPAGSMQTYATENAVSGTIGYMAPEYIGRNQISQKCDVYSLGFIMIRVIAGEKGPQNYDPHRPSEEFIERVHESWVKRHMETMSSHSLQQVKTCTEIALRCVEYDREKRPTITDIVDELNKIDAAESSALGGQNSEKEEHTTLQKEPDIQEQNKKKAEHLEEKMKEKVDGRTKVTPVTMDLHKAVGVSSVVLSPRSRWIGSKEKRLHDDVLHLQSGLQHLRETLPRMYNLIDVAEWKSHEKFVAMLFPKLKDAVYDADDLLDVFRWHEMKVKLEGNARTSPFTDFIDTVIQGSFNKLNDVQVRLDRLSSQLEKMGLREVTQHFDKVVRPETSSLPSEDQIFGRDNEMKQVMALLSVPADSKRKRATSPVNTSTSMSASNKVSNGSRIKNIPVLPIVGIGGVGKTTLAQHICSNKQVKAHFELIIWICVSDDFDVKRLTKEVIQSCPGKKEASDNLDSLQRALSNMVENKQLLIVLDDIWDDALKENGQSWKRFCAPLKSAQEGSMMLVTTRCPKVAKEVRTTVEPTILEGLKDDVFWNFFKLCAFGSQSSSNDPVLERIGRNILPKLKGSPLAAKTLGRILRMDLQASHWNSILESELWKLTQEVTDILPALRLSYMYLPFYLKRCFSFCAVYPKDYIFNKEYLIEIWVAEGFVESKNIGFQYFQELVDRSFFQETHGGYVIHDLLHDMAQKVSEHDCFILRNKNDCDKVPPNVRHIYILANSDVVISDLLRLCKHTKLRTLFCMKWLPEDKISSVMDQWCTELPCIRLVSCASTNELPQSIGNLKHLRYLKISAVCSLSIPSTFCRLYHLQILDVGTCKIESLPNDFSDLRNLQRFVSQGLLYNSFSTNHINAANQVQGVRLMKNLNQFRGHLEISNVGMLSKDHATEAELKNKKFLDGLSLGWSPPSSLEPQESQIIMQNNAIEVLQALQPPINLKSLLLQNYPGFSLPSWFQLHNINLNEIPDVLDNSNDSIGIFLSLRDLTISGCQNLSSLKHFLQPDYVPAIERIQIRYCNELVSLPGEGFGGLSSLKDLSVYYCPRLNWQRGLVLPSCLQTLELNCCGDFSASVPGCLESLTSLLSLRMCGCYGLTTIPANIWCNNLALLENLELSYCPNLVSIGGANAVAKIKKVIIYMCPNLEEAEQIMRRV